MIASPASSVTDAPTTVVERSLSSCLELMFPAARRDLLQHPWNGTPGTVSRPAAQAAALNFAPARWLLLDADAAVVADAVAAGAVAIDVEGKWRCFDVRGAQAASLLSSGVNVAAVLEARDCAAVSLFDCPAVITRRSSGDGFEVYVSASYAVSLRAALETALQRSARS